MSILKTKDKTSNKEIGNSINSAIGLFLGQGLFTIFIFLLGYLIIDSKERDYFVELLIIGRLLGVTALVGIDKYSFLMSSRGKSFNLLFLVMQNKKHFSVFLCLVLIISIIASITFFKESSFIFLFSFIILISLNEIQIQTLLGIKKLILGQFFQYGFMVLSFTLFYLISNSISIALFISVFSAFLATYISIQKINESNRRVDLRMSFSFGFSISSGILVSQLLNGADLFFYKLFYDFGSYDYAILTRLSFIVTLPLIVANNHFVIDIGKLLLTNKLQFLEAYLYNKKISFFGSLIFGVVLTVVFPIFFDSESFYFTFKMIYVSLICLIFSKCISALFGGVNNILMYGDQKEFLKNSLVIVIIAIIIYPVFIYNFAFYGLVIGNAILLITQNIINKQSIKKLFDV